MAASIARKVTAVLFAMAMIGSIAVGPALADDDDVSVGGDGVSVGGDGGVTVGAGDDGSENGSATVEAEADEDGVDAGVEASAGDGDGTSGELDCDVSSETDPSDTCETSSTDSGGDDPSLPESGGSPEAPDRDAPELPDAELPGGDSSAPSTAMDPIRTPEVPVDAPDLPVSYTGDGIEAQGETVVPFGALPNFCNPPYGIDDVQENNPVDPTDPAPDPVKEQAPEPVPTEPPQTPVGDPLGLVSAPISQCDVFNPYDPAVNPTSPPDDPSATVNPQSMNPGQDGAILFWTSDATADEEERSPGAETLNFVKVSQDRSRVLLMADGMNGRTNSGGSAYVSSPNDPSRIDGTATATVFGQGASLTLDCDGSECKPSAGGVPSGDAVPAFPAAGGDDGGEDPEPDPSADTGEPDLLSAGEDGVIIVDDRRATLGDGLPGGDNEAIIILAEDRQEVQQDADGGQGDNQANVENDYQGGENLGDDDAQTVAKVNGAGVVAGFECDDYRCMPTEGTGVYAGPAGMIFDMIPDAPEPVPEP